MSIIVEYNKEKFDLKFEIINDEQVKMLCLYAKFQLIYNKKIYIVGLGKRYPRYIDGVEQDVSFKDRDVTCFDVKGNFLWKIQPSIYSGKTCPPVEKYSFYPYSAVGIFEGRLCAWNRDGIIYELNENDGSVTVYKRVGPKF